MYFSIYTYIGLGALTYVWGLKKYMYSFFRWESGVNYFKILLEGG
jgi:hypothetical protein